MPSDPAHGMEHIHIGFLAGNCFRKATTVLLRGRKSTIAIYSLDSRRPDVAVR